MTSNRTTQRAGRGIFARDMQYAITDTMLENPQAEDDEEDTSSKVSVETLCKYIARLDADEMETLTSFVEQNNTDRNSTNEDTDMPNTLANDQTFLRSVREAAEAANRRIAVDDRMAAEQRNQEGFASRYGANGTRIKVDHAGVQGIPERGK